MALVVLVQRWNSSQNVISSTPVSDFSILRGMWQMVERVLKQAAYIAGRLSLDA